MNKYQIREKSGWNCGPFDGCVPNHRWGNRWYKAASKEEFYELLRKQGGAYAESNESFDVYFEVREKKVASK